MDGLKIGSYHLKIVFISLILNLTLGSIRVVSANNQVPKNMIGFFQSYDGALPQTWYFGGPENLKDSGYTIIIDAFWTNYPYCWGDGSGIPGKSSPIPICKGISNAPGPGLSNQLFDDFWVGFQGEHAPSLPGDTYNAYWTSLHTTGPHSVAMLRSQIIEGGYPIQLLASIGGWNMGGSSGELPIMPKPPEKPAWDALLKSPEHFSQAMSDIMNIQLNGKALYDGIDIDIETRYGEGCKNLVCTRDDVTKAIDDMVLAITFFKKNNPNAILSISPRASDLVCAHQFCPWNTTEGLGFVAELLVKLAGHQIFFDHINPQFYNDQPERNIPNRISENEISYGSQVVAILQKIKELGIIGPNTSLNIGVLAQTNNGQVDSGGASLLGNPGLPKKLVPLLWEKLQTDPDLVATGIKIDGLMNWSANLALDNQGKGGNVRTVSSSKESVVPFNWGKF